MNNFEKRGGLGIRRFRLARQKGRLALDSGDGTPNKVSLIEIYPILAANAEAELTDVEQEPDTGDLVKDGEE